MYDKTTQWFMCYHTFYITVYEMYSCYKTP